MSADDSDVLDEPFTSILAACDDALAAGTPSGSLSTEGLAPELHSRLQEDLACLQRLQQLRPRSWRSDTSIGIHGEDKPLPLLELPRSAGCFGRFELRRELGRGG